MKKHSESSGKKPSKLGKDKYSRTTGERIAKLKTPTIHEKELLDKITVLSREPFSEILALFLDAKPNRKSVNESANKSPDRYAQSVAVFARLAGYSDKLEIEASVSHNMKSLSDATLRAKLIELGVQVVEPLMIEVKPTTGSVVPRDNDSRTTDKA